MTWKTTHDLNIDEFDGVFRKEMEKAGFKVEGDPDNLFKSRSSSSDYAVAGVVKDLHEDLCFPWAGFRNMSSGKYHRALYSKPAAALRKTRTRVALSVMAFSDSCTAARAMMPTVAALRPERRAYASAGRTEPIEETPIESAYIPSAPGRLGHL